MKYKVGDKVRVRRDLEVGKDYGKRAVVPEMANLAGMIATIKSVGRDYYELEEDIYLFDWTDEMIEGLWEENKPKLKLIDILNKIANGELKEGTKLVLGNNGGIEYKGIDDYFMFQGKDLTREVKLIEPDDFADVGKMAETNQFREDTKMIETTDKTKIEELRYSDFWEWDAWSEGTDEEEFVGVETATKILFYKLNEVIRKLNKEDNNE